MTEPSRGADGPDPQHGDPAVGPDAADAGHPAQRRGRHRLALTLGGGLAGLGIVLGVVFGALYETGSAPFTDTAPSSGSGPVAAATQTWVDAMNSQKVDRMRASVCAGDQAKFANDTDKPPVSEPVRIDSVRDVSITGDTATATMTASVGAGENKKTQDFSLAYKREGGTWKVCQSAGTAQAPR